MSLIDAIQEKYGEIRGLTVREHLDGSIEIRPEDWPYDVEIPSQEELQELRRSDERKYEYRAKRKYPPVEVQLDALYHDIKNARVDQSGKFFDMVQRVKDRFPKPEITDATKKR